MKRLKKDSKAYWERQLEKAGLGLSQPLTDNSEGGLTEVPAHSGKSEDGIKSKDRAILRRMSFDGDDLFVSNFEIKSVRKIAREIPDWAVSNARVQAIILTAFPDALKIKSSQRKSAARWIQVIHLYYRMVLPRQIVAKEMSMTEEALNSLLQRITRVAEGKVTGSRGSRRKNDSPPAPVEGTKERGDETIQGPHLPSAGDGGRQEVGTKK